MRYEKLIAILFLIFVSTVVQSCGLRSPQQMETLNKILQQGNAAYTAKQYDEAIRQYDSGLALSPGEPVFLTNKANVFLTRGVERYNSSVQITDEKQRNIGKRGALNDFRGALDFSTQAVNNFKNQKLLVLLNLFEVSRINAFASRSEALRMLASLAEPERSDEALSAMHEYIDIETNPTKKLAAQLSAGKMLIDARKGSQAAEEYKNILKDDPNSIEANLGAGLALSQSGDAKQYQEARIYFKRFVELAPDSHPMKQSIKQTIGQ